MAPKKRPPKLSASKNGSLHGSFIIIACVPLLLLTALWVLPWDSHNITYGFSRQLERPPNTGDLDTAHYTREVRSYDIQGVKCEAWLYTPKQSKACCASAEDDSCPVTAECKLPIIIMAHGIAHQRDMSLNKHAEALTIGTGAAVFLFDYRGWGGSDGEPRHHAHYLKYLQDWNSTVTYVAGGALGPQYDASRLALWGTSYSAGHIVQTTAHLPPATAARIKALVCSVPYLDRLPALASSYKGSGSLSMLRAIAAAIHDWMREKAGLPLAYIPLIGPRGTLAMLPHDAHLTEPYITSLPQNLLGGWKNLARPIAWLDMANYRPGLHAAGYSAPTLFIIAKGDTLCAPEAVHAAVQRRRAAGLPVEVVELDGSHFAFYYGEGLELAATLTTEYLNKHLMGV